MKISSVHKLIVTIVKKGWAERILTAAQSAGARGGTVLHGRGSGIHEQKRLLGIPIEPEKDIILTLVHEDKADVVLSAIVNAGQLQKPGTGIGFVLDIEKAVGIVSLLDKDSQ